MAVSVTLLNPKKSVAIHLQESWLMTVRGTVAITERFMTYTPLLLHYSGRQLSSNILIPDIYRSSGTYIYTVPFYIISFLKDLQYLPSWTHPRQQVLVCTPK